MCLQLLTIGSPEAWDKAHPPSYFHCPLVASILPYQQRLNRFPLSLILPRISPSVFLWNCR